ncbi:MAG: aminoacyl-tRNA hydrolase [Chlamydiae bacterium]|nr:aminoacyl-tRNA hydrolase [Chlamydiota bacterium]
MTEEGRSSFLIVGLGNPGKAYESTRHNMGFLVGQALAKRWGIAFENKKDFQAQLAKTEVGEHKVMVLLPTTYMNLSGQSVRRCVDFFKIELSRVLVVCDDVEIPFGKLRFKSKGSSGGHNGLKSIEAYLGTPEYFRLRLGVGKEEGKDLADFVLETFRAQELEALPVLIRQAAELVEIWVKEGYRKALEWLSHPQRQESKKIIQED